MKNEFKKEDRYIVIKRKVLTQEAESNLRDLLLTFKIPTVDCVVIEHDWPNYDQAWSSIETIANGEYCDPYEENADKLDRGES